MLRDVWIDEKPTGPSSLRVYMLVVRPPPRAKMAKAGHAHPNPLSTSRRPVSPEPIPPSPLRFCTQHPFIPQTGNFHTPSAHRHQNSRSACSPHPKSIQAPSRPRCGAQICHQKTGPLGWREISPGLTIGHWDSWCRGFYTGQGPTTGMHDLLVRRADSDVSVGRPWALFGRRAWQKLVFFEGRDEEGGGGEGGFGARGWGACAMQRASDGAGSDSDGMG